MFSKDLAEKLRQAKALAQQESTALTTSKGLPPGPLNSVLQGRQGRLEELKAEAAEIANNITSSPSIKRAIGQVDDKLDAANIGSPAGLIAFFQRLGTQARTKYNDAQTGEIRSYSNLQLQRNQILSSQITSAHALNHLSEDLAVQTLLKEALAQVSLVQAVGQEHALREAFMAGWADIATHQEIKKAERTSFIKTDERDREIDQDIKKEREFKKISREDEDLRARDHFTLVIDASMELRQKEKTLRAELEEVRRKRYEIDEGDDPPKLKAQLLADKDDEIQSLQEQLDGIKAHYREANPGKEARRPSEEDSNSNSDTRPT